MPHQRGKRSLNSRIRRKARSYIINHAFRDPFWAETICVTSRLEVLNYLISLSEASEGIQNSQIPDVDKGVVLMDSRGRGIFQKQKGGDIPR